MVDITKLEPGMLVEIIADTNKPGTSNHFLPIGNVYTIRSIVRGKPSMIHLLDASSSVFPNEIKLYTPIDITKEDVIKQLQ